MANSEPATVTGFFEGVDQIGLVYCTCLAVAKWIVAPSDLAEFMKDGLKSVFFNLRKPHKRPNMADILIEVQPYTVSEKSKMLHLAALKIVKYYELTLRPLTPSNMSCAITKNFEK